MRKATGCFVPGENQDTSLINWDALIVLVFFKCREKKEKMAARPVITKKSYTIEQEEGYDDVSPKYIIMVRLSGKKIEIPYGNTILHAYDDERCMHFSWSLLRNRGTFDFDGVTITSMNMDIFQDTHLLKRLLEGEKYEHPYDFERWLKRLGFVREKA